MTDEFTNGFKSGALWAMYFLRDNYSEQLTQQVRLRCEAWERKGLTDNQVMQEMVGECLSMAGSPLPPGVVDR